MAAGVAVPGLYPTLGPEGNETVNLCNPAGGLTLGRDVRMVTILNNLHG